MKKFAAIALALIVAMSGMFATVATAADEAVTVTSNKLAFTGFEIVEGSGVVVDIENMLIYGLEPELKISDLSKYLKKGDVDDMYVEINGVKVEEGYLGTGAKIVVEKDGTHKFDVVIFGDITGDSVYDVLDASIYERFINEKLNVEPEELDLIALGEEADGELSINGFADYINAVVGEKEINQNAGKTDTDGLVEIDDQVYVSENTDDYQPVADEDITLSFNDIVVDEKYYTVDKESYDYKKNAEGEIVGTVDIVGKGLFGGKITVEFNVVSLLEKAVATVNEVIEDANLSEVVEAKYELVNGVADIKVEVDASDIIRGNFDVNMAGLNGLLAKIDAFQAKYLQEASLTVGDLAIATNGDFDRAAIKALVFDIAKGIFCDIAKADDNVVKSYSGVLVTNNTLPAEFAESFNVSVVMTGTGRDIDRVKAFASKISRYVAFDVVDGNAVVDIKMPAGFATKVVDILGQGDVEKAQAEVNKLNVYRLLGEFVRNITVDDISAGAAAEIEQLIKVLAGLDAIVDKALDEVSGATVTDANGKAYELLNGKAFVIDANADNKIAALVDAVGGVLTEEILLANVSDFCKDGIYTVSADIELDYRNIKETIIVNFDLFGAAETPDIIEETATYFSGIIADLGLDNAVAVSYDAAGCRALATLDAREFVTNFAVDETAFDGLYTDIKGYFDDNYGTSTIVVDGKEIVTAGKINKSVLKDFIFTAATGFFQDAANLGVNNVLRSFDTVVTEADGTEHKFDLDFALVGSQADIDRVASIAAKVADYVSFDVVNGNAVVNVGFPAGMRAKIIELLGEGDAASAQAELNKLNVYRLLGEFVRKINPEDISVSNATEIQAIIDMIASVDSLANKALSKVTTATVDVNGKAVNLLSGKDFVVNEASIDGLVTAFGYVLSEEVLLTNIAEFMNEDGTYEFVIDAGLSIGGIKETVIVNIDIFGDIEKENAIEDTVDYVGDIIAELGISSFASVELAEGKAVATFNASELLANGLNFNEAALDGLYTEVKDYFNANFSDSTITVGDYVLVKDGAINKTAVKDFLFNFVAGFFTDIANMDAETIRSYNTVVVDGEGNVEEFAFDFNLAGKEAHIEKLKTISAKVAELVSFKEVDGNAVVDVKMPAGMSNKIIELLGKGDAASAQEELNKLNVYRLLGEFVRKINPEDISTTYADDIQTAIDMVADVDFVINKLLGKVTTAKVDVNGKAVNLLSGKDFVVEENTVDGLVTAFARLLSEEILLTNIAEFMNKDGSYTFVIDAGLSVGGIKETVTVNIDIF